MRVYVNGTQVGSRNKNSVVATSPGALRIGGNAVYANEWFKGTIDEVRLYNRALSATEIQTDMNTAITPLPPPPPGTADLFMSPPGSDAGSCTADAPCLTLDRAY